MVKLASYVSRDLFCLVYLMALISYHQNLPKNLIYICFWTTQLIAVSVAMHFSYLIASL